jgi:hypothetical protein
MDRDRVDRTMAAMSTDEAPEVPPALNLFTRCGIMALEEANAWRIAVRARVAELSEPDALA